MSNFLAVDTSSIYLTVVAQKGEDAAVSHSTDCAMQHSVILMGEIDKCLDKVNLKPSECDYFVAVTGPGSFTGIRIGISCVKGLAVATGKRAAGVTSFKLLTYNINSDVPYLVAIDALHEHYYVCGFDARGNEDLAPAYLTEEAVEKLSRPVYGFEDLPLKGYTKTDIACCLERAAAACGGYGDITALYVRKSQAEEAREGKAGKI